MGWLRSSQAASGQANPSAFAKLQPYVPSVKFAARMQSSWVRNSPLLAAVAEAPAATEAPLTQTSNTIKQSVFMELKTSDESEQLLRIRHSVSVSSSLPQWPVLAVELYFITYLSCNCGIQQPTKLGRPGSCISQSPGGYRRPAAERSTTTRAQPFSFTAGRISRSSKTSCRRLGNFRPEGSRTIFLVPT